jgi:predicted O-methyltransferase YrrM
MNDNPLWSDVDAYLDDTLVNNDDALASLLRDTIDASDAAGLPSISVTPSQGKLLHLMARMCRAQRILEIGTLGGYSTIWLARALQHGGSLVTLEYEPLHADVARANLERAGLSDMVDVRVGAAADTLARMHADGEESFDFVFIDADKVGYPDYLEWAVRLGHSGTVSVADNVIRDGKVADAASEDGPVQAVRRMFDIMARHPDLDSTAIQTVGAKGYDGFSVAMIR